MPESLPQYDSSVLEGMKDGTYLDRAERILGDFLTDFTPEEIRECVQKAYGGEKFSGGHPCASGGAAELSGPRASLGALARADLCV